MSRKIICTNCNSERASEEGNCSNCGSNEITIQLNLSDNISFGEALHGKVKETGKKRPTREFKYGDDYSRSLGKYVDRTMIVDRENDQYLEIVKDKQTDEIIHECSEPLKQHYGHGNAKSKNQ